MNRNDITRMCVGRPNGYAPNEECRISVRGGGLLGPCPIFVTAEVQDSVVIGNDHFFGDDCPRWRLLTHDMQILWSSDDYNQGLHDRYSAAGVGGGWAICFA